MTPERKINLIHYAIIATLWILLAAFPLFFVENISDNGMFFNKMAFDYSVVFIVFLINHFVLMPFLFFKKRYLLFFLSLLLLLFFVIAIFYSNDIKTNKERAVRSEMVSHPQTPQMAPPRGELHPNGLRQPPPRQQPPTHHPSLNPGRPPKMPPPLSGKVPIYIRLATVCFLVIGIDMGLTLSMKWLLSKKREEELKKEGLKMQLAMLQNQVSPHFFMNTLNNIHALVEIDPQKAQETIIELSQLMDYLLYETKNIEKSPLNKEIEFVDNYINLMKIRCSANVKIEVNKEGDFANLYISPLLFLNFIENSFKHGISTMAHSFITLTITAQKRSIEMDLLNSNHAKKNEKHSGLGLSNVKKRLDLLYNDKYTLLIHDEENTFHVNLKIPSL